MARRSSDLLVRSTANGAVRWCCRAGNAMGRNKIISARVAVWTGVGVKDGNHALVTRGATPVDDLTKLFEMDPALPSPLQSSLF